MGYHLINLILHALNATLVAVIAKHIIANYPEDHPEDKKKQNGISHMSDGQAAAAVLFLVHPVQVECVAWIFQIKTLLATAFMLFSWKSYLEWKTPRLSLYASRKCLKSPKDISLKPCHKRIILTSIGAFFLSLCAKTSSAPLSGVLLWHHLQSPDFLRKHLSSAIKRLFPFFFLSGLFLAITLTMNYLRFLERGFSTWDGSWNQRIILAGYSFWHYFGSLFWPFDLKFLYPKELPDSNSFLSYLPFILIFWLGYSFMLLRKTQLGQHLFFFFICYLILLFPALGWINIPFMRQSLFSDHWQYPATTAIFIFLGITFDHLDHLYRQRTTLLGILLILFASMTSILSYQTWKSTRFYKNEEIFWKEVIQKTPQSAFAWNSLGVYYSRMSRDAEAERAYQTAVKIDRTEPPGLFNLAISAYQKKDWDRAYSMLIDLISFDPKNSKACKLAAKIAIENRRADLAFQNLDQCINQGNSDPEIRKLRNLFVH
jgi:tetratricopeptide (TPR) repeat protein